MSEKSGEGHHIAAVQNPLSCEGMTVAVNTGGFNPSPLVIFVKHMIASAFHKLLSKHITKEKIFFAFIFTVFQILIQNMCHCLIDRDKKRFSILSHVPPKSEAGDVWL